MGLRRSDLVMQTITVRLKLSPSPEDRNRLIAMLRDFNECANWIAAEAWLAQTFRRFDLHHLVYGRARECFPEIQAHSVCRAVAKVANAYNANRDRVAAFRESGAIELHKEQFRFTSAGLRIALRGGHAEVPYTGRPETETLLANKIGQIKIGLARDGSLFAAVPVQIETPEAHADSVIGVDLGIANIATDSTGKRYSGAAIRGIKSRRRALRTKLQKKGTRSAKRRLKRLRRRDSLYSRDINHCISKKLVAEAERTKAAIALEDLKGIGRRIRVTRKKQRAEFTSWSFGQLRSFIEYKAALAGVPVVLVDPANTSRECAECGHVSKKNRPDQATFICRACGHKAHADINAARVIASRAALNRPYATPLVASLHGC